MEPTSSNTPLPTVLENKAAIVLYRGDHQKHLPIQLRYVSNGNYCCLRCDQTFSSKEHADKHVKDFHSYTDNGPVAWAHAVAPKSAESPTPTDQNEEPMQVERVKPEGTSNVAAPVVTNGDEQSKEVMKEATNGIDGNKVPADNTGRADVRVVEVPATPAEEQLLRIKGEAAEGTGTSLDGQVQEFEVPTKKSRADLPSMTTKQYLDYTVTPILHSAMLALSKERPPKPVEYLAAYLRTHKEKFENN